MIGRPGSHPVKKVLGFTDQMVAEVERWRATQVPVPNFSEAIRRLVDQALKLDAPRGRTSSKNAARAAELAAKAIDRNSDVGASVEERDNRKRRILDGPSMAHSSRKDRS